MNYQNRLFIGLTLTVLLTTAVVDKVGAAGASELAGITFDRQGNLFVANTAALKESASPTAVEKSPAPTPHDEVAADNSQERDAQIFSDNLAYSREFYSGVHFVAIATLPSSIVYDRYPDHGANGFVATPERLPPPTFRTTLVEIDQLGADRLARG